MKKKPKIMTKILLAVLFGLSVSSCANMISKRPVAAEDSEAELTPVSSTYRDLVNLPLPKGKIAASVYGFRDQTGQYKPAPASSFSTAVTQGAAAMLVKALLDSDWFIPVEREGLQDLLTERKIIRAAEQQKPGAVELQPLMASQVLLQGGIVAYDSNVKTGGLGMRYFGVGANDLYRIDQVTVNLRAVDIRTGRVLASVSTTKTIYSMQYDAGIFRFVSFKRLFESELGLTRNEPAQLCVNQAIEAAVIHLIIQGIRNGMWELKDIKQMGSPVFEDYIRQYEVQQFANKREDAGSKADF
ncbi:CsgG/HfaB family protein [Sedimenticola sp.]|uniref:CsgG/HfaB family protein n=1 Tax=Sedimenticola sp. TaxID=1940285 RepID=UPI003D12FB29